MARQPSSVQQTRVENGGLVSRTFGPASPASVRAGKRLRLLLYPIVAGWRPTRRGVAIARASFDRVMALPPVRGTTLERRKLGGVPVEWTTAPRAVEAGPRQRVILYLHGGGFVIGSPRTHRNLVSRLSHVTATPAASVAYRMPPQVSLQASHRDVLAAYRGLLEEGYPPEGVIVAGDSAGGGLAAQLMLVLADEGLPMPAMLILLSPWLDLTTGGASRLSNRQTESFIGGEALDLIARAIVPYEAERAHWRNSPLFAPDELLAQLPPTLIQLSASEILADDGIAMAERIGAAGGQVELQSFAGQGHVVAMWAGLPDARRALEEIVAFVQAIFPDHRDPTTPTREQVDEAASSGGPLAAGPGGLPA